MEATKLAIAPAVTGRANRSRNYPICSLLPGTGNKQTLIRKGPQFGLFTWGYHQVPEEEAEEITTNQIHWANLG